MNRRSALEFSPGAAGPLLAREEAAEPDWRDAALCAQADPEAWFPEKGGSTLAAKKICRACPVRAECLEHAVENGEMYGVWGGLSERERNGRRPRVSSRPPARRPGYCGNDLHLMDGANTGPDRRCLACKRERRARNGSDSPQPDRSTPWAA